MNYDNQVDYVFKTFVVFDDTLFTTLIHLFFYR